MAREIHHGHVVDNDDPQKLGRLVVECPTIVSGESLGGWILPRFHFVDSEHSAGCFWVPNIGSSVDVEIESDPEAQVQGFDARWMCDVYPDGTVPDEFRENYPQRRGWKTAAGHLLYFDDTEDSQEINVVHSTGATIQIDNNGTIYIKQNTGQTIELGAGIPREKLIKGESFYNDLLAFVTGVNTFAVDPSITGIPGVAGACADLADAASVLMTILTAGTDLSDVTKTE